MKSLALALASLSAVVPASFAQFAIAPVASASFTTSPHSAFVLSSAGPAPAVALGHDRLTANYALTSGPALDVIAQQPLVFAPGAPRPRTSGYVARLAVDQELSAGAFRPFLGVALGRVYGEEPRENWSAGVGGGARYFLQPGTFVHVSLDYGWMFSPARSFNDRVADGQWTWSMGVGFKF